jgi:hypothetical protein
MSTGYICIEKFEIHQEIFRLHRTHNILSTRDGDSARQLAFVKTKF